MKSNQMSIKDIFKDSEIKEDFKYTNKGYLLYGAGANNKEKLKNHLISKGYKDYINEIQVIKIKENILYYILMAVTSPAGEKILKKWDYDTMGRPIN